MTEGKNKNKKLLHAILIAGSLLMLVPLVWMVLTSFKPFTEIVNQPGQWLPDSWQPGNYWEAFSQFQFSRYFFNSVSLTLLTVIGTLLSCTLTAYAFVAYEAPGKNAIFAILLSTMMLPAQVTIIPLFEIFVHLNLLNTYWPMLIPAWMGTNVFAIFLLRQFFRNIPREYIEAARIDGASELWILLHVFIPLAKPALATVAIFTFLGSWNDLFGPLIYLHDSETYTLPLGLLEFMSTVGQAAGTPMHLIMAVSTIMVIPVVILFFCAQRTFIAGIQSGGIKG
jgi:multiple sugar transport system permease protein